MSIYKVKKDFDCLKFFSNEKISLEQKVLRLKGLIMEFESWKLKTPMTVQQFIDHCMVEDGNSFILRPAYISGKGPRYPLFLIDIKSPFNVT